MTNDPLYGSLTATAVLPGELEAQEAARLEALEQTGLLDSPKEEEFDELVELIASLCDVPISALSLIAEERQWFKASYGLDCSETPRDQSVCTHAMHHEGPFIVEDLSLDPRFKSLALVCGPPNIRFYAGIPMLAGGGYPIGMLCVIDQKPRNLTDRQLRCLTIIARQVQAGIDLRLKNLTLRNSLEHNGRLTSILRKSRNFTQLLIDTVPTSLIALNADGVIQFWNGQADETFCIKSEAAIGKNLENCGITWADKSQLKAFWGLSKDRSEVAYYRQNTLRWLSVSTHTLENTELEEGAPVMLISATDITEQRMSEEADRQAQKLKAIGQLAAGVAHEINTPTQYVKDNIEFVMDALPSVFDLVRSAQGLRSALPEAMCCEASVVAYDALSRAHDVDFVVQEIPLALQQAQEGTKRIGDTVRAIKEFSHPGSKAKSTFDFNHMIQTAVAISRNEWKYVAELSLDLDPTVPSVLGYQDELIQVLVNLIVNASHAIAEQDASSAAKGSGLIVVRTRHTGHCVEVLVTDNGAGIPPEVRARMFELFYTTKEVGKGTGQGLSFAYSVVVEKHQGELLYESEVGAGTTFTIRLPQGGSSESAPPEALENLDSLSALRLDPHYKELLEQLEYIAQEALRCFQV